jgi:CTP:molybdopterin cytidylyltransferase MocA
LTIAALILAAGESTRMGRLKQLLEWGGTTLIAWQVMQMTEAGADQVIVVLGHAAGEIGSAVPPQAKVVVNESYREGRAGSLRRGAECVDDAAEAVVMLNVDQPRPAWVTRAVINAWREQRDFIVQPNFGGQAGHPVLVDGALLPELRAVEEATLGLRAVMERHAGSVRQVTISNLSPNVDLNTPANYAAALASFRKGEWTSNERSGNNMKALS